MYSILQVYFVYIYSLLKNTSSNTSQLEKIVTLFKDGSKSVDGHNTLTIPRPYLHYNLANVRI